MRVVLALVWATCVWGQIQQPQLGAMLGPDGVPRGVFGATGNATLGEFPAAGSPASGGLTSILNMGCSRRVCLLKENSSIVSYAGSTAGLATVDAPAGPAWFWFDRATAGHVNAALVYFPASRQLARWQNGQLSSVNFDVFGEILSIREAGDGTLQFAIRNRSGTWIVANGNAVVESLGGPGGPGAVGAVLLLPVGVLFATRSGLVLRRPDASEMVFPLGQAQLEDGTSEQVALSWLGENYVQVRVRGSDGTGSNYALRVDPGHERLFMLPEPRP
jgi:hypothetical protein